ncbi:MAG: hypothetical protein U0361_01985 [Nitrospiraceae bacterium]
MNGRVVRVALPRLVPQKTQIQYEEVTLVPREGAPISESSQLVYNGTALAEKSLSERMAGITTKALARAAVIRDGQPRRTRAEQSTKDDGALGQLGRGLVDARAGDRVGKRADKREAGGHCQTKFRSTGSGCRPVNMKRGFVAWVAEAAHCPALGHNR